MTDNTIMENLHNYLPKDLVNIVEEYSKDRTQYDNTMTELSTYRKIFDGKFDYWREHDFNIFLLKKGRNMSKFYAYCLNRKDDRQIVNIDNLQYCLDTV